MSSCGVLGRARSRGCARSTRERTPSFTVYAEQQRFVCFGCKVKGDVLDFVQLHEHLTSVAEACAWLTGTPPPPPRKKHESRPESPHRDRRWDRLTLEQQLVLNAAGTLYRDALWRTHQRWTTSTSAASRTGLSAHAASGSLTAAHSRRICVSTAVCALPKTLACFGVPSPARVADRCANSLPAASSCPRQGAASRIWFIGRSPNERQVKVKYLALPGEKPILGFERAAGRREAYLIEGVFDWLTAVTWNLPAFSTCGTDFPFDRLGWLARARVIFGVLDADRAGHEAAERFGAALGRAGDRSSCLLAST